MPKNILGKNTLFGVFGLLIGLFSCKSSQELIETDSDDAAIVVSEISSEKAKSDSIRLARLAAQKEYELTAYRSASTRRFDILDTELDLSFDYQNQTALGEAILQIKPFAKKQRELILDAKDFEPGRIYFLHGDEETVVNYRYDFKQLFIYLPKELNPKDTFKIRMKYTAFPERNSGSDNLAITDTKGLYFIDPLDTLPGKPTMIWTQGETEYNSKWFPTIDQPNERFTQTIHLTVADSLTTVSNGVLIKQAPLENGLRKDTWRMDIPHAPYLAAVAIGDFDRVKDDYNGLSVNYYVEKGYGKGAAKVFQNTPEMIEYFEKILQIKFPWPKYDQIVVRDFVSGAMENTTASIFMEELRLTEREAIDSEWDYIIAHELFHQWFGDYVTAESWSNLTLNEAFANYSEYLWNEYKYGQDEAKLKLAVEAETYFQEAQTKQVDLIRFYYQDADGDMFDAHSYSKGGLILHMLRQYLGDELFFNGLTFYLEENALQSVEVHNLRLAFEKVSGEDLNWFFNQWFLDKGHPELMVEVDYSQPENLLISVRQIQDLENSPLYRLPFEVSWYEGEERRKKRFVLEKAYQQFALENERPISQLYFEEGKNLLSKISTSYPSSFYVRQFQESQLGIARYEALDSLLAREENTLLQPLLEKGLEDSFWSIRELCLQILQQNPEWIEEVGLENKVYELSENDPENSVRAGAIDVLGSFNPDKYLNTFTRMANDSSYLVASSALMAMNLAVNSPLDPQFMERFEQENNYRILVPLAEYYLNQNISGKGDWFQSKLPYLSGEGLYYFLGYYSEYFVYHPEEGKEEATKYLLNQMENSPQVFVRLGAFQGLLSFADEPEILEEMNRIAALESNEQIKNYFEYFLQTLNDEN
ncbi:MAG: M1 family metallopeptidase [Algoriphagus sp.]|uniref:M1 family metallopeptidase n=1 Tax=Algoriphagus sp. TaxID=1872435 RepID=UPI0017FCB58F|nr:M1 family metallopeptidase [Algoriphagus sp.]NVJ84910.1 M1 family metallopeptidase [Algoriphagus sp.]